MLSALVMRSRWRRRALTHADSRRNVAPCLAWAISRRVLVEGRAQRGDHVGASGYHIALGEPRHVDVTSDHAYVVVPATMSFDLRGKHVTQTGSLWTVALRKVGGVWRLTAWAWAWATPRGDVSVSYRVPLASSASTR